MTTAWSHLPNAELIDTIIKDNEENPEVWHAVDDGDDNWYQIESITSDGNIDKAFNKVWATVDNTDREMALKEVFNRIDAPGYHTVAALIAWDDSISYLTMSSEQVHMLAILGDLKAILMFPVVWVFEQSRKEE